MKNEITTDIIVVGGGHAGIEAANSAGKMGKQVVLITEKKSTIGHTPCNPSIGGSAKGIVVREIAALGGAMPEIADKSLLQMKMLNRSKGPAVWSLRSQIDVIEYPKQALSYLERQPNVTIVENRVDRLLIENGSIYGVQLKTGENVLAQAVVVTTGTYMDSTVLVGHTKEKKTATGEVPTKTLSDDFAAHGFELFRLKTGTPARVRRDSIDFTKLEEQPGEGRTLRFSIDSEVEMQMEEELSCYLTYCEMPTIQIIQDNLEASAMYSGNVEGVGPRYCPSIEDKVVRFNDKEKHQVFLEPESLSTDLMYVQGMSTSMPDDVELKMLREIPGLEQVEVAKYGYAIEYDAIVPTQLYPTLETKLVENLYTAGQINGTSGYEEAAAQGLMAAVNAVNKMDGKDPFILGRDEAYIGVLIDDIVTKGTQDPYRLLTSRAEYRLLLRHDNADLRLMAYGYEHGLIPERLIQWLNKKEQAIQEIHQILNTQKVTPKKPVLAYLEENGLGKIQDGIIASTMLRRPEITWEHMLQLMELTDETFSQTIFKQYTDDEIEQALIQIKYEGYIAKAKKQAASLNKLEGKIIPEQIDYDVVPNLALEAKEKLKKILPVTLGQASRIAGVNAIDITMLDMYLNKK